MSLFLKRLFYSTKRLLLLFAILTIVSAELYGQKGILLPTFIYAAGGVYNVDGSFENYSSNNIPVFGGGIGLGISQKMYAFANISRSFANQDDSIVITPEIFPSPGLSTTKINRPGSSKFRQIHLNIGVYRNMLEISRFTYSMMGGVTFTRILDQSISDDGFYSKTLEGSTRGFFLGMGSDMDLRKSNISIFVDGIWNITISGITGFTQKGGGFSISTGLRYHFERLVPLKKRTRRKRRT